MIASTTHTYIQCYSIYIQHKIRSLLTDIRHSLLSRMHPGCLTKQPWKPPLTACSVTSTVGVWWTTSSSNWWSMALAELVHHLLHLTHPLVILQWRYIQYIQYSTRYDVCTCVCSASGWADMRWDWLLCTYIRTYLKSNVRLCLVWLEVWARWDV